MSKRLTRNTWEGGLNTDTTKSKINPTFYVAAHNLDQDVDGDFFALRNVRGTTDVHAIVSGDYEVLGVFANKYTIEDEKKDCLTIFVSSIATFKVLCYDPQGDDLYELYEETVEDDYLTDDRVVDAVGYGENNVDYIYFIDDYNELRYIRCEIPSPYVANFLTAPEISVQRRGAGGYASLTSVSFGGSLLSGSYQYVYRMVDPVNKRFTKWSSLTLPIHVYSGANSNVESVYSDYGLPTNFQIVLSVTPTAEELANFEYFQLAVVENVYPTGPETVTDGQNQSFVASLLPIEAVSDYLSGSSLVGYSHKTNAKVNVVPIEELVVDLAAIKTAKTLSTKRKKLILGNVKYHDLTFDNGDPAIGGGSIATRTQDFDLFSTHSESIHRGYFRDEVYRFGIVYYDKFGNKSPVKVLNVNDITDNQISGSLPDMRFPSRSTANTYTLFKGPTGSSLQSLGLSLTDIHNHPTWAVGFEIVRAKRIKKILSQTPVIPMTYVQGVGALDDYPSTAITVANGNPDNEYPDAQPQTTDKIYVPKNLFWPDLRAVKRREETDLSGGTAAIKKGEALLTRITSTPLAMIFPQNFMYGDSEFVFTGAEKLQTVDYCALKLRQTIDHDSSITDGDSANTRMTGTFYAISSGDYYFDHNWVGKSVSSTLVPVTGHKTFQNLDSGGVVGGKLVMDYPALQTEGLDLGFQPTIQKSVVVETTDTDHDIMSGSRTFASAGSQTGTSGRIFSSGIFPVYESTTSITNKFITEYAGFGAGLSYVQGLKIVNIVNNYGDDRYGDEDTLHEFISTGAKYFFTEAELIDVQNGTLVEIDLDVWGGDCFVSPHTFKVSDSTYSVVNQNKASSPKTSDSSSNLIEKWTKYFLNTGGSARGAIALPVGLDTAAQFVTVILESEYNGGVMAEDILSSTGFATNGIPVIAPSSVDSARSPLTYRYNINLSKQNDEKVYFPRPQFSFERSNFPSRLVYSDTKIYNTDNVGFDIFRVLNFVDLEENNGAITKLAVERDNLYAIQERGVVGLPVGETQLTTTDAGQIAVGTSDFFGRPIIINNEKGGQHIKGIVETGDVIFIPDNTNKTVYALAGNELIPITKNNQTLFRSFFSTEMSERNLLGIYDPQKKKYWLSNGNFCYLFDENRSQWVVNYEFPQDSLRGGIYTNLNMYLIGDAGGNVDVYTMYTGAANNLFGTVVTPRVDFVVNPDDAISKIFTNQAYITTERLASVDLTVEREQELADQVINGMVIAVPPRGGNYRTKLSRAAGNERLRGLRMLTTVKWKTDGSFASLSEVLTKYRHEARVPF